MMPDEYHLDPVWCQLRAAVTAARLVQTEAEAAACEHGYGDGRKEALVASERAVEAAEQAVADREETISHPLWGTF